MWDLCLSGQFGLRVKQVEDMIFSYGNTDVARTISSNKTHLLYFFKGQNQKMITRFYNLYCCMCLLSSLHQTVIFVSSFWLTHLGSTSPASYTRSTKQDLSHGAVFWVPPSLSYSPLRSCGVVWCSRGKRVALMLPEVLNCPTCDCCFHPSTPLGVREGKRELAAGFVGKWGNCSTRLNKDALGNSLSGVNCTSSPRLQSIFDLKLVIGEEWIWKRHEDLLFQQSKMSRRFKTWDAAPNTILLFCLINDLSNCP